VGLFAVRRKLLTAWPRADRLSDRISRWLSEYVMAPENFAPICDLAQD
jgi:hypothetical protein